jgi:hypothetical protein
MRVEIQLPATASKLREKYLQIAGQTAAMAKRVNDPFMIKQYERIAETWQTMAALIKE